MTQKHTPTPWIADQGYIFDADNNIVAELYAPANAAHIVKCVNLHDELVEALLDAKYAFYGNGPCNPKIENTLKKAGVL